MSRVKDERIRALEREVVLLKEIATLKEAARVNDDIFNKILDNLKLMHPSQYIPQTIQWVPPQTYPRWPGWPNPYVGDWPIGNGTFTWGSVGNGVFAT